MPGFRKPGPLCGVLLMLAALPPCVAAAEPIIPEGTTGSDAIHLMKTRMERWEPSLNAVITLQSATEAADSVPGGQTNDVDGHPVVRHAVGGPLHGLPVLLKDNIETHDMPTTAGSLALANNATGRDAELTRRLRHAGLLIAGKTNLSEWANFRDNKSTSGWSGVGGLTPNAWDTSRSACGSSSGSAVAVAAGYVPFAVGTETDGSIVCPASYNGVVGIKPTVGLVSRRGVVPIAHSQDTAGPMAYNVKAAALLLSAMEGEDANDPATLAARGYFGRDYLAGLTSDSLRGMKIGVIRSRDFGDGSFTAFDRAVTDLQAAGAVLTDDLSLPDWPEGFYKAELKVLLYEFKHNLNAYLAGLPPLPTAYSTKQAAQSAIGTPTDAANTLARDAKRAGHRQPDAANANTFEPPPRNLEQLIAFNQAHADVEMPWFGQDLFTAAQETSGLDSEDYLQALELIQSFCRNTLDGLLADNGVDVLVMPTNALPFSIDLIHGDSWHGGTSTLAAVAGYPHITVPAGRVKGLPVGLSFIGTAFSEPLLIKAAYGYEQATRHAITLEGPDPWRLEERWEMLGSE